MVIGYWWSYYQRFHLSHRSQVTAHYSPLIVDRSQDSTPRPTSKHALLSLPQSKLIMMLQRCFGKLYGMPISVFSLKPLNMEIHVFLFSTLIPNIMTFETLEVELPLSAHAAMDSDPCAFHSESHRRPRISRSQATLT